MANDVPTEEWQRLSLLLEEGEHVQVAGPAQSVEISKREGKGRGEGWLFLTNLRLWHWVDGADRPWLRLPSEDIKAVSHHWTTTPGIRELRLTDGNDDLLLFRTSKRVCGEMQDCVARQEADRRELLARAKATWTEGALITSPQGEGTVSAFKDCLEALSDRDGTTTIGWEFFDGFYPEGDNTVVLNASTPWYWLFVIEGEDAEDRDGWLQLLIDMGVKRRAAPRRRK